MTPAERRAEAYLADVQSDFRFLSSLAEELYDNRISDEENPAGFRLSTTNLWMISVYPSSLRLFDFLC